MHLVDSNDFAITAVGKLAVKNALSKAGTRLLQPMEKVISTAHKNLQGDITGIVSRNDGYVTGSDNIDGDDVQVEACLPSFISRSFIKLRLCFHWRFSISTLLEYCLWHHQLSLELGSKMFHESSEKDSLSSLMNDDSGSLAGIIGTYADGLTRSSSEREVVVDEQRIK
jgi:hypothetical protein